MTRRLCLCACLLALVAVTVLVTTLQLTWGAQLQLDCAHLPEALAHWAEQQRASRQLDDRLNQIHERVGMKERILQEWVSGRIKLTEAAPQLAELTEVFVEFSQEMGFEEQKGTPEEKICRLLLNWIHAGVLPTHTPPR